MRIATWNVNSVKARIANVMAWLETSHVDVLLLQELKCETAAFPALEFKALGYESYALGQKAYNGVAILTRQPAEDVLFQLPDTGEDVQSRYIEATISGYRIASLYLPNGNPQPGDKFDYKLAWMRRLKARAATLLESEMPVILGGDYNIIPEAIDMFDPKGWELDALYHPLSRAAWRAICQLGYTEAFRALHPRMQHAYTYWDYQDSAWMRDLGLRIDHFLLSPEATDRMTNCFIDRTPRGQEKASDHTPVILEVTD